MDDYICTCRLCGQQQSIEYFVELNSIINGYVKEFLGIDIKKKHTLPQFICSLCNDNVANWKQFSEQCKETQMKFNKLQTASKHVNDNSDPENMKYTHISVGKSDNGKIDDRLKQIMNTYKGSFENDHELRILSENQNVNGTEIACTAISSHGLAGDLAKFPLDTASSSHGIACDTDKFPLDTAASPHTLACDLIKFPPDTAASPHTLACDIIKFPLDTAASSHGLACDLVKFPLDSAASSHGLACDLAKFPLDTAASSHGLACDIAKFPLDTAASSHGMACDMAKFPLDTAASSHGLAYDLAKFPLDTSTSSYCDIAKLPLDTTASSHGDIAKCPPNNTTSSQGLACDTAKFPLGTVMLQIEPSKNLYILPDGTTHEVTKEENTGKTNSKIVVLPQNPSTLNSTPSYVSGIINQSPPLQQNIIGLSMIPNSAINNAIPASVPQISSPMQISSPVQPVKRKRGRPPKIKTAANVISIPSTKQQGVANDQNVPMITSASLNTLFVIKMDSSHTAPILKKGNLETYKRAIPKLQSDKSSKGQPVLLPKSIMTGGASYICPKCYVGFFTETDLVEHSQTHPDMIFCPTCRLPYPSNTSLISHLREWHPNNICHHDGCNYYSRRQSAVQEHLMVHEQPTYRVCIIV